MADFDSTVIVQRSIRGVLALASRTFIIQIINVISVFLLTIFLDPRTFGVFFVVSASLAFLVYFSDIGLAAALIQKKEEVTREDLVTTFTIQQILVVIIVLIAFSLSGFVAQFYNLERAGLVLFQALVVSFFLSSLKTIPSVILERNLEFQKFVIPQIVETVAFNIVAVVLAIKGFGITSFTFAVLARGIVGVLAMYLIAPWRIALGISRNSAQKLLSFGIPFQTNSLLALIKDDLLIIVLGRILTLTEVGFIGFAQKWAFMPLRLIMDSVIRVTFPSFSRLQEDSKTLTRVLEKTIFTVSFLLIPSIFGLVLLAPYAIKIIPQYQKWEPALISLTLFGMNALLSSISTPLTNVFNALGKIKITLRLMVFWTISTWVLTLTFIRLFGFVGVALASAIIATSVVVVIYLVRKHIKFAVWRPIAKPLFSGLFMTVIVYLTAPLFVTNLFTLILAIFLGMIIYLGLILALAKDEVIADIKTIVRHLK